ncbi:Pyrimidine-specific ribonucleoside hydrolase RihA (Cytidine/uridine-specific hydrolase) [Durusdinium trenchii]|uniref:Pyrimidine-specific ribonucleoside hydrolase RihA (Cytidine/uridine-specific hydrolase) n=2 Tax=Symbiodiniaceae TaxID=252141 RepID=A0A9P1BHT5_9DINO|nr:unnamed protein product [Cladocopium goreaui]
MNRADHIAANPDFPWLEADDLPGVAQFLSQRQWLQADEQVLQCGRAGEGNMNLTLRVRTDRRTFVVKQARPWVEKYDHIEAPWNRADFERLFYERVTSIPEVAGRMPRLIVSDSAARTLVLEYIDGADDFTVLYSGAKLDLPALGDLANYIAALHAGTRDETPSSFANSGMRQLNHAHIFQVPLQADNGVPLEQLEPGLEDTATLIRKDEAYLHAVETLGAQYLQDGRCLLHGDYFPGSWLWSPRGLVVIDPEFCFVGTSEVDLGCAIAHMALAKQEQATARTFLDAYQTTSDDSRLDLGLAARFAAVEVMRRLIGGATPIDVWLDVDTATGVGDVDDGLMLIQVFHSPEFKVRGLSVVFGNTTLERAVPIAKEIVSKFGPEDLSVNPGAASEEDLGEETKAVQAMAAALEEAPMTLLAVGPVTNVASLLMLHPELHDRIDRIVMVAARRPGQKFVSSDRQKLPHRDANFEHDAKAMQVILDSDIPLVFAPWEVSSKLWITREDLKNLSDSGESGAWIAKTSAYWITGWELAITDRGFNPFDTLAAGWLSHPELIESMPVSVRIEELPDDRVAGSSSEEAETKPYLLVSEANTSDREIIYCHTPRPEFKAVLIERLTGLPTGTASE